MSMASFLTPTLSGAPFGSGTVGLRQRRPFLSRELDHDDWVPSQVLSPACGSVAVSGPSRAVAQHLSWACTRCDAALFQRLAQAAKALKNGGVSDRELTTLLTEAHTQIITVDLELEHSHDAEADACRRYLQQLQTFLLALLRDIEEARQRLEARLPRAERDWQLLLQAASAKLQIATTTQAGSEVDVTPLDSLDSSCSSSVCGSSSCASSGTSKSGHRLVAMRGRLGYSNHWACKVAI